MVNVNDQFAAERARQIEGDADRKAWLDAEVDAGRARKAAGGKYVITDGIDAGEKFAADGVSMTGLDVMADGRTAFYSKDIPPWHEMGQVIPGGLKTAAEVLAAAGLDYVVVKEPSLFEGRPIPGKYVTVRADTRQPLGVVGEIYEPFQNLQAYGLLDELLEYGMVVETAGSFRGGSRTFISARMPGNLVIDPDGIADVIEQYMIIHNSHDGTTPVIVDVTPWRPVCKNTEGFALRDAVRTHRIRHTKAAPDKAAEASQALGLMNQYYSEWVAEETVLLHTPITLDQVDKLIGEVWGELRDDAPQRSVDEYARRRRQVHDLFENEINRVGLNAYAAERAVTAHVDHFTRLRPRNDLRDNPLAALGQAILEDTQGKTKSRAHARLMTLANR